MKGIKQVTFWSLERLPLLGSLKTVCWHITKFWPKGREQKWYVQLLGSALRMGIPFCLHVLSLPPSLTPSNLQGRYIVNYLWTSRLSYSLRIVEQDGKSMVPLHYTRAIKLSHYSMFLERIFSSTMH